MVDLQKDFFDGNLVTQDCWIVRLEVQGEYSAKQVREFAGYLNIAVKRLLPVGAIVRIAEGKKRSPDKIIPMQISRRCLRFRVYNIKKKHTAFMIREALHRACNFLHVTYSFLEMQVKPPRVVITPDQIRSGPKNSAVRK